MVDHFGCNRLDAALIDCIARLTSRLPHRFLRRRIFFAHRPACSCGAAAALLLLLSRSALPRAPPPACCIAAPAHVLPRRHAAAGLLLAVRAAALMLGCPPACRSVGCRHAAMPLTPRGLALTRRRPL
uniref:Uncharacterized protein n=1 Tax=Oryza nivara TaxID=4536 RepID=A0A0E0GXT9_ORYNI